MIDDAPENHLYGEYFRVCLQSKSVHSNKIDRPVAFYFYAPATDKVRHTNLLEYGWRIGIRADLRGSEQAMDGRRKSYVVLTLNGYSVLSVCYLIPSVFTRSSITH